MSELAPLGKIKAGFTSLIWLQNALVFGVDKDEDLVAFINQIFTCSKPDNDAQLVELVNRQTHRHSHSCRKKTKNLCRFNYPRPPMRSTQILFPINDDISQNIMKTAKELWKHIKNRLNDLKEGKDITFDQLLE